MRTLLLFGFLLISIFLLSSVSVNAEVTLYNFSDSTNNKAYNDSAGGAKPPGWSNNWGGIETNAQGYTNLSTDNGVLGYAKTRPGGSNLESFWRFNFTINETIDSIDWINVTFNGFENAAEASACYIANFSDSAWQSIGAVPSSDGTISYNFTTLTDINKIIDAYHQLVLMCQGDDYEAADFIFADYVLVKVGWTPPTPNTIPQWFANATNMPNPMIYDASANMGFQINWTDTNFANATFQLGRPSGALTNYTNASTIKTAYASGDNYTKNARWYINFTQDQIGGAGTYNYTWFGIDTAGSQNSSGTINYTISKAATNMELWLNGTEGNSTYFQSQVANFTTKLNMSRAITLRSNYTGFADQTGTQTITNYTNLLTTGSFFNLTAFWGGDENYTGAQKDYLFNTSSTNIGMCLSLTLQNAVFTLTNNVSSAGTCFNILADNITLDGNGYWINYSQSSSGSAVSNGGYDNITIRNLNIVQGSASGNSYAIYGEGMSNSTITNSTIRTLGSNGHGILFQSSSNSSTISGNRIITSGGYGIYIASSGKDNVSANEIITSGYNDFGMYIAIVQDSNILSNNITTSGDSSTGIYLLSSESSIISNNMVETSNEYGEGIHLDTVSNSNLLSNNTITTLNDSSAGIRLVSASSLNTISSNKITTSGQISAGVSIVTDSNTILDNNITTLADNSYAISISSSNSNNITGGSIIANMSYDYYITNAGATNNFTNTNFTAERSIYFADIASWFNYRNDSSNNIWLKTNLSAAGSINRTLVNWNSTLMKWNDSETGKTAAYNITGLQTNAQYNIYNASAGVQTNPYAITTDSNGNLNFTIILNGNTEIVVNTTTDSTAPQYWSNATSKPSGTEYNTGNNYGFRIRWTDATGADKVVFETNLNSTLKNFTAILASGTAQDGIYTINFTDIEAGSYQYRWFANDTGGNVNGTFPSLTYSISKNTSIAGTITCTPSSTVTYSTETSCSYSEANGGDSDVVYKFYRDNIEKTSPETSTFGVGTYQYKLNTTAGTFQNYTSSASMAASALIVNQNTTNLIKLWFRNSTNQYLNQNMTIIYGDSSNSTAMMAYQQAGTLSLYYDDISRNDYNNTILVLGAGLYKVTANTSGNENYTSNSTTFYLRISKAPIKLTISPGTQAITYGTSVSQYCSDNSTSVDCNIYRNSSAITNNTGIILGAGVYNYTANITDTANYTIYQNSSLLTVNPATPSLSVGDLASVTYPSATQTGCQRVSGDSSSTITLYRNGTQVAQNAASPANETLIILGAAVYNYTCTVSATANYTIFASANNYRIVSQNNTNPIEIYLSNDSLSALNQNITTTYPATTNATAYLAYAQAGTLNLYRNDILQISENGTNITRGAGLQKITANTTGNQNYSANTTTFYINVSKGIRTISLALDGQASNITRVYNGTSALYAVSASESNAGDADATYILYENSASTGQSGSAVNYNVNRGNNTFIFVYNSSASENWTAVSLSRTLQIWKGAQNISITGSQAVSYPSSTTVIGTETNTGDSDISYLLYRNGSVSIGTDTETNTLGAGAYGYTFNSTAGENWTANSTGVTATVTVSKGATETKLWLNGTRSNLTYTKNNYANFTVESNASGKTVYLDANITGWVLQSGTATLNNYTNLTTEGTYNITGYFPEDENYSASSETWFAKAIGKFIELDLVEPTGTKLVQEGQTFAINATIKCKLEDCGEINATPRYNEIPIPEASGTIYVGAGQQLKNCTLNADESCSVSWSVSTTTIGTFNIDVNASGGASNETSDATLSVYRVVTQIVSTPSGGTTVQEGGVSKKESPLMDLEITNFTPKVGAGEKIRFEINLTNVGGKEMFDAVIHKRIKKNDTIIVEKVDTRAMTSRLLFKDDMDIPANLEPGKYFLELYVEYVNKTASALVTFDIKKTCLAMQDISYSLMTKNNVLYADSLDSITLKFDNTCDKDLKNAVLYLDGNRIDIGTIRGNYSKAIDFDKYGLHKISIEYDGGTYVSEFYLDRKLIGDIVEKNSEPSVIQFVLAAVILAAVAVFAIYLSRKMPRIFKPKEKKIEKRTKIRVVAEPYTPQEVKMRIKKPEPRKKASILRVVLESLRPPREIAINARELEERIKAKIKEKMKEKQ